VGGRIGYWIRGNGAVHYDAKALRKKRTGTEKGTELIGCGKEGPHHVKGNQKGD